MVTETSKVSVVIATYNRLFSLKNLLEDLAVQRGFGPNQPSQIEVVVVDDGSKQPVAEALSSFKPPYQLRVLTKQNGGQASARHAGILEASGEIIVVLDDDMRVEPEFISEHLKCHLSGMEVVFGEFIFPKDLQKLTIFERWHISLLVRYAREVIDGITPVRGSDLSTGNVSFRRQLYLDVGGFDTSLRQSEDKELGIRFEKRGARIGFSRQARSMNCSDHTSMEAWFGRALGYGSWDLHIAKKHPDIENVDPWRFLLEVSPAKQPLIAMAALAPRTGKFLGRIAANSAIISDRLGLERIAMAEVTMAYGLAYFVGIRNGAGTLPNTIKDFGSYLLKRSRRRLIEKKPAPLAAAFHCIRAVRSDYNLMRANRLKYSLEHSLVSVRQFPKDLLEKIGLQMMLAIRLMHFLRDSGIPKGGPIASRLIRFVYGSDVHFNAEFAPGINIIHGMGMAISSAAKLGSGCVLSHNITLGHAVDAETRQSGAPILGKNVHLGPGATLIGPITVGDESKVMAGSILNSSVPPRSLVCPGNSNITTRKASP